MSADTADTTKITLIHESAANENAASDTVPSIHYDECEDDIIAKARDYDSMRDDLHTAWKDGKYQGENPDTLSRDDAQKAFVEMINRERNQRPRSDVLDR